MHRTKIDWADYAWSPVTGCLHGCEYCYARKQTARFSGDVRLNMKDNQGAGCNEDESLFVLEKPFVTRNKRTIPYPFGFAPTLHKYRLDDLASKKKGANIFVCSMSDLFGEWVPDEWITMVFEACKAYPKHNYIFLTKNPSRYTALRDKGLLPKGDNYWYGVTATDMSATVWTSNGYNAFLSIEPILEDLTSIASVPLWGISWVIVGAETGNRKAKVIPEKSWIEAISIATQKSNIPLFMKSSIQDLMADDFVQSFPAQLSRDKPLGDKGEKKVMGHCMECRDYGKKSEGNTVILRKGREGRNRTIGYLCDACLVVLAKKWGTTIEED